MQKKKPSGLTKKIPAIFEGLPDIDSLGQKEARVQPPAKGQARNQVLLVEVNVSGVKAIMTRIEARNCVVLKTYVSKWEGSGGVPDSSVLKPALEKCLREFGLLKPVPCRLLVRGNSSTMLKVDKPDAPAAQLKDALIWQLAEKLSFPVERSEICYQENQGMVTVAAMDVEIRDRVLEAFHALHLHPEKVMPLAVLYEGLQQKRSALGVQKVRVVDLSEDQVSMVIFTRARFQFMREAPYGYEQILKAMKGTLMVESAPITIDYKEAHALLSEFGLPTPDLVLNPQEPIFEKITQEMRSTLAQFQKQSPSEKIEAICLSGLGESIKGMDQYLANQLNLPVRRLDLKNQDARLDGGWAGVLGLGYVQDTPFNFAALEDSLKPKFEKMGALLKRLTFLSVMGVAGMAFFLGSVTAAKSKQLADQTAKFSTIASDSQKMAALDMLKARIQQRQAVLSAEMPKAFYFGGAFREISQLMPAALQLSGLSYEASPAASLTFTGKVLPGTSEPDVVISGFLKTLNNSPFFKRSVLDSRSEEEQQKVAEFVIRTDLVPPAQGAA